jgi:phosphoglycolate phosphatase
MNHLTLVFDLDGTLTDSRPGIVRCFVHALRSLGARVPEAAQIESLIGAPLRGAFVTLLGSDAFADDAVTVFREMYAVSGLYECAVYAGVESVIESLQRESAAMFVATSKPHVFAERVLEHCGLSRFFRRVYGAELTGERADKRELLAHVLQEETLDPAEMVMIGDRSHDVIAARANGAHSIGVAWGYGSVDELRSAGADRICATPAELIRCVGAVAVAC